MIALLLIFPVFATCNVHIDIIVPTDTRNGSVRCSGISTWPITEAEQRVFHITDGEVYQNSRLLYYKAPSTVVVRRDSNDPDAIKATIRPTNLVILSHEEKLIGVAVKAFSNQAPLTMVYKADFKEEVNEIIRSTWFNSPTLAAGKISMTFGDGRFALTSFLGEQIYRSIPRTISHNSEASMSLEPGQEVQAVLKATKATVELKIDYEVTIHGDICIGYKWFLVIPCNKCYSVQYYLGSLKYPTLLTTSSIISVEYYYGAKVEVVEKDQQQD